MFGIVGFAEEEVPKTSLLSFYFKFFNNWDHSLPPILISWYLDMSNLEGWKDIFLQTTNQSLSHHKSSEIEMNLPPGTVRV